MQPEQPLIAPTLMGRGGDTALGMEQRSPEQRPPYAASPRAAVQVVLLQPLLAAASVPLYAGPIQWMGQLAGPISGFVGGGTLPLSHAVGALVGPMAVAVVVESGRCERGRQSGWTAG